MTLDRHKYEYQVELEADSGPARVIRMVGVDKNVLEIGSGPGSITKILSTIAKCRVTAADIDAESLARLALYCERVCNIDLNSSNWVDVIGQDSRFDVVVAADVLEHVYEPLVVLKAMKGFLNASGCIIISLPHVGHSAIHACLLDEDFEYGDFGLLDHTHIRFFGIKNIQKLFFDAGLKIIEAEFVVRHPEHTEFAKKWSKISPELRKLLAENPFGSVYQIILKAVPSQADGVLIDLINIHVLDRIIPFRVKIKALLRSYLSAAMYSKLRLILAKLGMTFKG
jgi:2-polyprenyl-3-methyl-5-hydroxy-6-metoxy-1,4-benzoquinol methylase